MKKLICVVLFIFFINLAKVNALSASSYIVMDLDSGRVVSGSNYNEPKLIASITKIMTSYVAIKYGDLEKLVTVDEDVLKAYGSAIYIEVGEELTLKELLYGLMLRSGNDAAIEIANAVTGSMDSFVYLMNEEAQKIGMKNTNFVNNHGLEENDGSANKSSAYDMALITKEAYQLAKFREIFGTKEKTVKTNYKTYRWISKNKLIHKYDFITGGKTGYTEKARRTLVTTGSKDNVNLVVVTINDGNDFQDHIDLYNKYFNEYRSELVLKKEEFDLTDDKYYKNYKLYIKNDYRVSLKNDNKDKVEIKYNLNKNDNYIDNTIVGTVDVYLNKEKIHEEQIYAKKITNNSKEKVRLIDKIKGWFSW